MRLDKLLSHTTGITRKEASKLIRDGRVRVAGELVRDTGFHVTPDIEVTRDGETLGDGGPRYFMLHKPQGVISATVDGEHETVLNLLDEPRMDKLHIAGRLDIDTTGLVVITDDGQWSHRITHPGRGCRKVYRVAVTHAIDPALVELFRLGVMLHGEREPTLPAELQILDTPGKNACLLILQEGRHHQVKRMFASVDNRVTALHRERIGEIRLDPELEPGEYRALTPEEIASVR